MTIVRLRVCVNCSSEGILTDKKLYKALRKKVLKEEVSRGESTVVSSLIKSLFRYALMRNVIFRPFSPRQPARCGRDALFSSSYAATREIVRMNRRNDRAIIPRRGTRNFRNKETNGAPRRSDPRRNLHTKCIYVYGMYVLRESASRKFRCFEPFERDLQQFSAARREETSIPSLLHREYSEFYARGIVKSTLSSDHRGFVKH